MASEQSLLPFTRGRRFTEANGYLQVPVLCDETGQDELLWSQHDSMGHCHCCAVSCNLNLVTLPCILRPRLRDRDGYIAYDYYTQQFVERPHQMLANTEFALCDVCNKKCEILMQTSDHVALGVDWWDLVDSLTETLKTYCLPSSAYPVSDIVRKSARVMCALEDGVNATEGILSRLNRDVLTVLAPHVLASLKEKAAALILSAYRNWHQKVWTEEKFNGDEPSLGDHYYACRHSQEGWWAKCYDCNAHRQCYELQLLACCDRGCCNKYVCLDGCAYICKHCGAKNCVTQDDHLFWHNRPDQDPALTVHDRRVTPWQCWSCSNEMSLNRTWAPALV